MRMSRPQKSQMRGFRATQRGGVADAFAQNQIQEFQTHVIQGAGARIACMECMGGKKRAKGNRGHAGLVSQGFLTTKCFFSLAILVRRSSAPVRVERAKDIKICDFPRNR